MNLWQKEREFQETRGIKVDIFRRVLPPEKYDKRGILCAAFIAFRAGQITILFLFRISSVSGVRLGNYRLHEVGWHDIIVRKFHVK